MNIPSKLLPKKKDINEILIQYRRDINEYMESPTYAIRKYYDVERWFERCGYEQKYTNWVLDKMIECAQKYYKNKNEIEEIEKAHDKLYEEANKEYLESIAKKYDYKPLQQQVSNIDNEIKNYNQQNNELKALLALPFLKKKLKGINDKKVNEQIVEISENIKKLNQEKTFLNVKINEYIKILKDENKHKVQINELWFKKMREYNHEKGSIVEQVEEIKDRYKQIPNIVLINRLISGEDYPVYNRGTGSVWQNMKKDYNRSIEHQLWGIKSCLKELENLQTEEDMVQFTLPKRNMLYFQEYFFEKADFSCDEKIIEGLEDDDIGVVLYVAMQQIGVDITAFNEYSQVQEALTKLKEYCVGN